MVTLFHAVFSFAVGLDRVGFGVGVAVGFAVGLGVGVVVGFAVGFGVGVAVGVGATIVKFTKMLAK